MKIKLALSILFLWILAGCSIPVDAPPPPTALPSATPQPANTAAPAVTTNSLLTQVPTSAPTTSSAAALPFCDAPPARDLIAALGRAIASRDGELLASLVSPSAGLDVRYFRDGRVINYDRQHARFVFESTFQADWGISPGSGEPLVGAFHEIVLPSLQIVFTPSASLQCNQIEIGGATYDAQWPYPGMNFFSVHFPGTEAYGQMDWQTWAVGMDVGSGKPLLATLAHFMWEP
jgi:hypothetical protein